MSKRKIVAIVFGVLVAGVVVQAVRVRGRKKDERMEEVRQALDLAEQARMGGRFATAVGQYENAQRALQPLVQDHQDLRRDIQKRIGDAQDAHVDALFAKIESEREAGRFLSALDQIALAGTTLRKYGSRHGARREALPEMRKKVLAGARAPALERTRRAMTGSMDGEGERSLFCGVLDERVSGYSAEYEYREDKFLPGNKIFEKIRSLDAFVALRVPVPVDAETRSRREDACRALLEAVDGAEDLASRAAELNELATRVWELRQGSLEGPVLLVKIRRECHEGIFRRMRNRAVEDIKGDMKPPWMSPALGDTLLAAGMGTPEQVEARNRAVAEEFRAMAREFLETGESGTDFVTAIPKEAPGVVAKIFKDLPEGVRIAGYAEE